MNPDGLRQMLTACGILLVLLAPLLLAMPVDECASCVHCARKRVEASVVCPLHKVARNTCDRYHKDETP